MNTKVTNRIALFLVVTSFACLVPGLYLPAITLDISPTLPFVGKMELYHQTRSILGTIGNLYDTGNVLVSSLIFLFSVMIPILKGLILFYVLLFPKAKGRKELHSFISAIGKWSMADVFVMGIFLTFLAAGSAEGLSAQLEKGFWWFLGYCLLSVLSAQVIQIKK